MDIRKLRNLLGQPEGLKLDFKQELYKIDHADGKVKEMHWHEFIKDILSLINGNLGVARKTGYLIIGAADTLSASGERQLFDIDIGQLNKQTILDKLNACCEPPLHDIDLEICLLDSHRIAVISIPPTPYLHQITKDLKTKEGKSYTTGTVFIRRGASVVPASSSDRESISNEKKRVSQIVDQTDQDIENLEKDLNRLQKQRKNLLSRNKDSDKGRIEHLHQRIMSLREELVYLKERRSFESKEISGEDLLRKAEGIWCIKIPQSRSREQPDEIFINTMKDDAKTYLYRAIDMGYDSSNVYLRLAEIYDDAGDLLEAFYYCKECLQLDKSNSNAQQTMIKICRALQGMNTFCEDQVNAYLIAYEEGES